MWTEEWVVAEWTCEELEAQIDAWEAQARAWEEDNDHADGDIPACAAG